MNFFLSLTLYNPLESFVIIYALYALENKRFEFKNNIKHFYFLGTINLLFQYILHFLKYTSIGYYINISFSIFIAPIILYYYFKIFIFKIRFKNCFIIQVFYIFTLMFFAVLLNYFFDNVYVSEFINFRYEFISNICVKILQFSFVFLFYFVRRNCFEKYFEKNC